MRAADRSRYARHLVIPEMGEEGQHKLGDSSVLVVGAGGLGSPCLFYLAAAGVGRLGIVDSDVVEASNLQRQIIHATGDIGWPKTTSAAEKLRSLNPSVEVVEHACRFAPDNALDLIERYDVVVDAVDNLPSRFLVNDACVIARRTLVEAAILRFVGLAMTIRGGESACYRCLFPDLPLEGSVPSPAEAGVFGPVAGLMGCIQAAEVVKVLLSIGRPLYDRLLQVDALEMSFDEVAVQRDPRCPVCRDEPGIGDLRASAANLGLDR